MENRPRLPRSKTSRGRRPCNSRVDQRHLPSNPEPAPAFPGANWEVTYTGNSGFVNNVIPNFTTFALEELWSPNDKLVVNLGLRDEIYYYNLANTSNDGQNFWFLAGQREFCYNPATLSPYFIPVPAGERPAAQSRSSGSTVRSTTRFRRTRCKPSIPTGKTAPAAEQSIQPDAHRLRVYAAARASPTRSIPTRCCDFRPDGSRKSPKRIRCSTTRRITTSPSISSRLSGSTATRRRATTRWCSTPTTTTLRTNGASKAPTCRSKLTPYYRYATNQVYIDLCRSGWPAASTAASSGSTASSSSLPRAISTRTAYRSLVVHVHQRGRKVGELSEHEHQSDRSVQSRHRQLQRPNQSRRRIALL